MLYSDFGGCDLWWQWFIENTKIWFIVFCQFAKILQKEERKGMKGSSFMDFMSAAKRQFDLYKLFQKCLKTYKKIHSIPHRSLPVLNS